MNAAVENGAARAGAGERVAFCASCSGVVPFAISGRARLTCQRCGTRYRLVDRAAQGRWRALRYLIYAGAAGLTASLAAILAAVGPDHPRLAISAEIAIGSLAAVCLACLARSAALGLRAADFGVVTPLEMRDARRCLCPGMIRSDVIDALSRRGWGIGKIRSVIEGLEPLPPDAR